MMSLEFSFRDVVQVLMPKPLVLVRAALITTALAIVGILISMTMVQTAHPAEYTTYMRVVGFNGAYVIVVDADGQRWEVKDIDLTVEDKVLEKGVRVLVIMNLKYNTNKAMFTIGDTYIQSTP
jgi:hypothetical protein